MEILNEQFQISRKQRLIRIKTSDMVIKTTDTDIKDEYNE